MTILQFYRVVFDFILKNFCIIILFLMYILVDKLLHGIYYKFNIKVKQVLTLFTL